MKKNNLNKGKQLSEIIKKKLKRKKNRIKPKDRKKRKEKTEVG